MFQFPDELKNDATICSFNSHGQSLPLFATSAGGTAAARDDSFPRGIPPWPRSSRGGESRRRPHVVRVLLGAVLGSTAIKAGATVILVITAAGIALLTRRGVKRRELEVHKNLVSLVSHYCRLLDSIRPAYEVVDRDETATIGDRGDTHTKLKIKLRATREDLSFVRLKFGCGWPQPSCYRSGSGRPCANLLADGSPGTTLRTTVS